MTTREISGYIVNFDEEGFMTDPEQWNEEIAQALAEELGLGELTPDHWTVIKFSREDFEEKGEAPGIRRITKASGVPTKKVYKLFPKGPAKKIAFVSGLGKPKGCI